MQITPIGYYQSQRIKPPWNNNLVGNAALKRALMELSSVVFSPEDIQYIKAMGIRPPFMSGAQVLNFLNLNNIKIGFEKFVPETVRAQYAFDKKIIFINEKYKNTTDFAEILAIASSIMHEVGHAADGNFSNSVQEELNCLSLNVLTHRFFKQKYPKIFENSKSFIINEGVNLYEELFFDKDTTKTSLIQRVHQKYGFLQAGDFNHPPGIIALKVKGQM